MARRKDGTSAATKRRNAERSAAHRIEADEFHPDAKVAAAFADQSSRVASVRDMKQELARLETRLAKLDLTQHERVETKKNHRQVTERLHEVEREIADFEKEHKS
jgi:hypothetical protein